MGAQTIDVPGQGPIEFPDTMSDTDIVSAIKKMSAPQSDFAKMRQDTARLLKTNPGTMLGDAAYKIGGAVTDAASNVGLPAPIAAGAGYAANVGWQAIPTLLGMGSGMGSNGATQTTREALGAGANGISGHGVMRSMAEKVMQNAVKPTARDLETGKADRAIATMLDEGVGPTRGGMAKLKAKAMRLNSDVEAALTASNGATIPKGSPPSRIQTMIANLEQKNALPAGPRAAMESVNDEFLSNPLIPQNIPVDRAQQFKQTLYQDLKNKYGTLSEGSEAAKKALAMGLKEDIEQAVPAVAPLNAKASELWNALNVAERRALMASNVDSVGLAWLTANPKMAAAYMANKNPYIRSLLARSINALSVALPTSIQSGIVAAPTALGEVRAQRLQNQGAQQ